MNEPTPIIDRNVEFVREKLLRRSRRGIAKYGVTTERTDLELFQWVQHAQEEAMDMAVYMECVIQELRRRNVG